MTSSIARSLLHVYRADECRNSISDTIPKQVILLQVLLLLMIRNWLDEIFETAPMQKHNLSISGANEKSDYYLSLGYLTQDGIIKRDDDKYKRISAMFNGSISQQLAESRDNLSIAMLTVK